MRSSMPWPMRSRPVFVARGAAAEADHVRGRRVGAAQRKRERSFAWRCASQPGRAWPPTACPMRPPPGRWLGAHELLVSDPVRPVRLGAQALVQVLVVRLEVALKPDN